MIKEEANENILIIFNDGSIYKFDVKGCSR